MAGTTARTTKPHSGKSVKEKPLENPFYGVEDVQRLLANCSRAYAYRVIKKLNDELSEKGFVVRSGYVPKKYFHEKYYV